MGLGKNENRLSTVASRTQGISTSSNHEPTDSLYTNPSPRLQTFWLKSMRLLQNKPFYSPPTLSLQGVSNFSGARFQRLSRESMFGLWIYPQSLVESRTMGRG